VVGDKNQGSVYIVERSKGAGKHVKRSIRPTRYRGGDDAEKSPQFGEGFEEVAGFDPKGQRRIKRNSRKQTPSANPSVCGVSSLHKEKRDGPSTHPHKRGGRGLGKRRGGETSPGLILLLSYLAHGGKKQTVVSTEKKATDFEYLERDLWKGEAIIVLKN